MRSDIRRKMTPLWKQELAALIAIVLYLAFALCAVQAWTLLSEQADAFASKISHVSDK